METRQERLSRQEREARAKAEERVLADSGASGERFGEPRGWALKWDGPSLPEDREVEEGGKTWPTPLAR
jgi:hypothetical protein